MTRDLHEYRVVEFDLRPQDWKLDDTRRNQALRPFSVAIIVEKCSNSRDIFMGLNSRSRLFEKYLEASYILWNLQTFSPSCQWPADIYTKANVVSLKGDNDSPLRLIIYSPE